ncbi:CD180 antigen isoform X2 [Leptinotarsa decemlineata]|uniref:CD180 antigen isoform X2 n=1 Tax=Leptinotarsa decemlineata TaxID=7539 RepID=UPI003D304186
MLRVVILAAFVCLAVGQSNNTKFPFCKLCKCETDDDVSANVTCTTDQRNYIFENSFWFNQSTNESYAYNALNFQNNQFLNLSYVFPKSNLTYLDLSNNAIYRISDGVFQNLQKMITLILSYNGLEMIHPDAFKGVYMEGMLMPLRSLKEIRLDHNKLHTLNQDLFEHCTDIEILDLSHNPIETIDHHTLLAIDSLPNLRELYLQYTEINTLPENMLHTPKYLRILDLSGNTRIDKIPNTLIQARSLEKFYLNNTGFVNLTEDNGFPEIPSLKTLHLCRNQHLSVIGQHSLSKLTGLEELRLSYNIDLSSIHPKALARSLNGGAVWPPIKKFYIEYNKIAYLDSDILSRWDTLSGLDIRENPWTCECENRWLIEDLLEYYLKIDEEGAKKVMCAAPIEMKSFSFYNLYEKKSHLRCLDLYGARPERDGPMLVGILAGVLIAIPAILFLLYCHQRGWFSICGICDKSARRLYDRGVSDDML